MVSVGFQSIQVGSQAEQLWLWQCYSYRNGQATEQGCPQWPISTEQALLPKDTKTFIMVNWEFGVESTSQNYSKKKEGNININVLMNTK